MIKRDEYLNKLINRIGNDSIKIITGIRRVGKSYLINEILYEYLLTNVTDEKHIIRFSFDSAIDLEKIDEDLVEIQVEKRKVNYKKFIKYINSLIVDENKYFLLFDEVQLLDHFEFVLNGYLSRKQFEIFVTGSNSKFLSSDVLTEFRGRGDEIHVMPLNFKEYYEYTKLDYDTAIHQYLVYGGLPRVVLSSTNEEKNKYLLTQLERTYLTDIIDRNRIKNDDELEELLDIIASGISSLTNPKKLSDTFNSIKKLSLTDDTIKKYIEYFKDAYMIDIARRFDIKGKKYISTPYKIYFEDIGIRNARLNFRQIEETHLMENLIYNELKNRGYNVDVGVVEIRENNIRKNLEVDFVVNNGSKRYYIQSAYRIPDSEKMQQELKSFGIIKDSFKKVLIVMDNIVPRYDENGYLFISLKDFLLENNILEY